jgi:hypothetical protein
MQAYVGGEVTASGRTKVPLPEVQEEVFDLSALEALAAQGMQSSHGSASKHSAYCQQKAHSRVLHVLSSALPR